MAIQKPEVGKLSDEEVMLLNRLEHDLLDPKLNKEFDAASGTPYVIFDIAEVETILGQKFDHRLLVVLQSRYPSWSIRHRSERDGSYLQFD